MATPVNDAGSVARKLSPLMAWFLRKSQEEGWSWLGQPWHGMSSVVSFQTIKALQSRGIMESVNISRDEYPLTDFGSLVFSMLPEQDQFVRKDRVYMALLGNFRDGWGIGERRAQNKIKALALMGYVENVQRQWEDLGHSYGDVYYAELTESGLALVEAVRAVERTGS